MLAKLFFLFIGLVNARKRFRCRSGWTTYTSIFDEKEALSKYGSSASGASLGDILGSVLKKKD